MNSLSTGRPHQILLLDRDIAVREVMNEVLVEANYLVLTREYPLNPTDVRIVQPDLIILDIPTSATSPEMDYVGYLKSDAHTAHIPILAVCKSNPAEDVSAWSRQNGIAGLLLKPFDLDDFLDAVQSAIESANIAALIARYDTSVHQVDCGAMLSQPGLPPQKDAFSE